MSWKGNIEDLHEKFWNGESTLEEEKILKTYYADNPSEDVTGQYFLFLKDEGAITYSAKKKDNVIKMGSRKILSIAASVAVLVAAVFLLKPTNASSDVYVANSPEEALLITQNTLAFISGKVNKSNDVLFNNLSEYNKINFFK